MRNALRISAIAAIWAFLFVAIAQIHVLPENSPTTVIGAVLWLFACTAIGRARPHAQARRLVVLTAATAIAMLAAAIAKFLVENTVVPDVIGAIAFVATLQCYAATLAEVTYDIGRHELEATWEMTGRFLIAVDVVGIATAVAWATQIVERRSRGRFRVSDIDLGPVGNPGRVVLGIVVVVCAAASAVFLLSAWRTWSWSREPDDATTAPS